MQVNESRYANLKTIELIAAILAKTRAELIKQIKAVESYLKTVQIDIMDNDFVPNKTIGLEQLRNLPAGINYEFHWMVQNPEKFIREIKNKNALHLVHVEAMMDFEKVKKAVAAVGGKLGIAFNPETSIEKVLEYEKESNYFLAMTVHPGFSGQKYISEVEDKIKILRERNPEYDIEVDGGINIETIKRAIAAGANRIVAASAIFGQKDISLAIKELEQAAALAIKARYTRTEVHG